MKVALLTWKSQIPIKPSSRIRTVNIPVFCVVHLMWHRQISHESLLNATATVKRLLLCLKDNVKIPQGKVSKVRVLHAFKECGTNMHL